MIEFLFGVGIAISFVLLVTFIHSWMEMRFDQRAAEVFDADDERTEAELKIIHENQLPLRATILILTPLAADMQAFWPWLALFGVTLTFFWMVFDILCAVVWLGKPWYYTGDPPAWGWDPYLYFFFKGALFSACLFGYIFLVT
jgi:hypothetical protein